MADFGRFALRGFGGLLATILAARSKRAHASGWNSTLSDFADMPQPLSRVKSNASVIMGNSGDYPLEDRPELLRLAMRVISAWSAMESFMAGAFITILGASAKPALAMYTELTSTVTQKAVLRAAARSALSAPHAELFEALITLFSSAAEGRNKIAHWIWGICTELPDAILLAHPNVMFEFQIKLAEFNRESEGWVRSPKGRASPPHPRLPLDEIFVYREKDFKDMISSIEGLAGHFWTFGAMLSYQKWRAAELYSQLRSEPEIRTILDRRQLGKSGGAVPPQSPGEPPQ